MRWEMYDSESRSRCCHDHLRNSLGGPLTPHVRGTLSHASVTQHDQGAPLAKALIYSCVIAAGVGGGGRVVGGGGC